MRDSFTQGYMECAVWSSTDDAGQPLDQSEATMSASALKRMELDCATFQAKHGDLLSQTNRQSSYDGHDFWLTRNGHGAGFWDGDIEKGLGDALTKASKEFGECDLYIGDDNQIYIFGAEEDAGNA